jgi:hypothetical protein
MNGERDKTRTATAERRRHDRIPIRFPVAVRASGIACRGVTINLSASGVLLALPIRIPLGDELTLSLELPDEAPPLVLRAFPLRIDSPAAGAPFRTALHFLLPGGTEMRRIRKLVYGH